MKQTAIGCIIWLIVAVVVLLGAPLGIALLTGGSMISFVIGIVVLGISICIVYGLLKARKHLRNDSVSPERKMIGKKELATQIVALYNSNGDKTALCESLTTFDQKGKEKILVQAFKKMIENRLGDGNVDENEASRIISYFNDFGLSTNRMMKEMEYVQLSQLVVINCVLAGRIPSGMRPPANVYVNYEADEQVVLTLENTIYYELVEIRTRVGYSGGHSIRVAKGVYLRSGAFFSTPITSQQLQKKGEGALCVTTKNIYFCSSTKTVKIPYGKVVSYTSYSDGIGIHLSDSRRRPIVIGKIDGWFVYNVLTNINTFN
ncbi:MAG: hypothetical protein IJQ59_04060 [Bacteroidaceae bacterium]|nr:hypothetical protein [Bacteroidaceae bacterium]